LMAPPKLTPRSKKNKRTKERKQGSRAKEKWEITRKGQPLKGGSWAEIPELVDRMIWHWRLRGGLESTSMTLRTSGFWETEEILIPVADTRGAMGRGRRGKRGDERKEESLKELPPPIKGVRGKLNGKRSTADVRAPCVRYLQNFQYINGLMTVKI